MATWPDSTATAGSKSRPNRSGPWISHCFSDRPSSSHCASTRLSDDGRCQSRAVRAMIQNGVGFGAAGRSPGADQAASLTRRSMPWVSIRSWACRARSIPSTRSFWAPAAARPEEANSRANSWRTLVPLSSARYPSRIPASSRVPVPASNSKSRRTANSHPRRMRVGSSRKEPSCKVLSHLCRRSAAPPQGSINSRGRASATAIALIEKSRRVRSCLRPEGLTVGKAAGAE